MAIHTYATDGKLSTSDVSEMRADAEILNIGLTHQVKGARELMEKIIGERDKAWDRKIEFNQKQHEQDIRTLQKAAYTPKPKPADVSAARQRMGADF